MLNNRDNGEVLSKRTIHEIYICLILVSAIIVLAAVQWYRIDRLVELISFALTISSLVLAIVAIGYSIYSGTGIERSVGNLLTAVTSIRSSATDIESLRGSLSNDIRALSESVGLIATTVTSQSDVLAKLAESRTVAETAEPIADFPVQVPPSPSTVEDIVERGSQTGAFGLLAVARCKERGAPVDLIEATKGTALEPAYLHGYLVALIGAGIISASTSGRLIKQVDSDLGISAVDIKSKIVAKIERGEFSEKTKKRFVDELMLFDQRLKGESDEQPQPPAS